MKLASKEFGGLPAASPAPTGRPRLGSARRLRPEEVETLVAGYGAGRTMKELAAEFGVSRQTVGEHLRRAKVRVRRGGLGSDQAAAVVALYGSGWTSRELAERYDVSADTVLRTLRRQGVEVRSHRALRPLGDAPE